ncbi:DNA-binding transcriptional regulator, MarR family [Thermomonospora echinospora]|uniref:DNA-binding transcriptional regulator, MarR family n=1 Tax=Thermomonospora echinospora TaxID=1992 RepID=A0A1H6E721_9ACTN|nr:MarR family transcriptional regulator [Thermomonospora echinospora]SEG92746.1 DNA-binding transcriptional regulator, MarR family [Thermomonospora echinospora]
MTEQAGGTHSRGDEDLRLVLDSFGLILGRWTAVGMQDLILARARVDVDPAMMTILLELDRVGGTARPSHLAQHAHTSKSNVSKVLARLLADGLVDRVTEPDDLRAISITLTPAGRWAADRINETSVAMLTEMMGNWPQNEIHQFAGLLNRFAQSLRSSFLLNDPG